MGNYSSNFSSKWFSGWRDRYADSQRKDKMGAPFILIYAKAHKNRRQILLKSKSSCDFLIILIKQRPLPETCLSNSYCKIGPVNSEVNHFNYYEQES